MHSLYLHEGKEMEIGCMKVVSHGLITSNCVQYICQATVNLIYVIETDTQHAQ